jgi:hypothetical protein
MLKESKRANPFCWTKRCVTLQQSSSEFLSIRGVKWRIVLCSTLQAYGRVADPKSMEYRQVGGKTFVLLENRW